jgi:hypothetical protein
MSNDVTRLYQDMAKADMADFLKKKEEFESILGVKVDKEFFDQVYVNAKYCPETATISRLNLVPLYLQSKGRLPKAANTIYKHFTRRAAGLGSFSEEYQRIVGKVNEQGYYVIKDFLNADQVEKIKQELNKYEYFAPAPNKETLTYVKLEDLRKSGPADKSTPPMHLTNFTGVDMDKDSGIGRMMTDTFMADISAAYFQSQAYLTEVTAYHTKAKSRELYTSDDIHGSAQAWHFDYADLRFLKFFLYLTDVNMENGPHTFAVNTQEDKFIQPENEDGFYKPGFRRYPNGTFTGQIKNEWVVNAVGRERVKEFCGTKGMLIIENTSGLHKGGDCVSGSREMLSFTFGISNFNSPNSQPSLDYRPEFPRSGHLAPVLKDLKQEHLSRIAAFKRKLPLKVRIRGKVKTLLGV